MNIDFFRFDRARPWADGATHLIESMAARLVSSRRPGRPALSNPLQRPADPAALQAAQPGGHQ